MTQEEAIRGHRCPKCGGHVVLTFEYKQYGTDSAFIRRYKCERCGIETKKPEALSIYRYSSYILNQRKESE